MMHFMEDYGLVPKNFDIEKTETFATTRSMLAAVLNKDEDVNESISVKQSAVRYSMKQFHRAVQTENKILIAYTPTLLQYELGVQYQY